MTVVLQVFRVIAACSSLFMILSPTPMVYKMYKDRDTGVMSIVPLLAVLVNSHMWMLYGYLDENYMPVFATFLAGDFISVMFVAVFYRSTKDGKSVHNAVTIAGCLIVIASIYSILGGFEYLGQTRHQTAQVTGILCNVTVLFMYGSPLVKIVHVFKYKSAAFIPVHMVCMGATNNVIWITYAVLASKWLILIPASGAFCLSMFQVILYLFIYHPSTHPLPASLFEAKESVHGDDGPSHSVAIDSPQSPSHAQSTDFVAHQAMRSSASTTVPQPN